MCKCTNFNIAMNLVLLSACLKLSFLSFTCWQELRRRDKNKQAKEGVVPEREKYIYIYIYIYILSSTDRLFFFFTF